jgi:hypothetical protein
VIAVMASEAGEELSGVPVDSSPTGGNRVTTLTGLTRWSIVAKGESGECRESVRSPFRVSVSAVICAVDYFSDRAADSGVD